jgi:UDP-2-acetamido-2,6-beta-L-arabino-hexul-4-ose reductase
VKTVLVTGARGFIGRNLGVRLRLEDVRLREFSRDKSEGELAAWVVEADVVIHLAGVNRPDEPSGFRTGNVGFTERLVSLLAERSSPPHVIFASSIQATLESPYGTSKREAEDVLRRWSDMTGGRATILRLKNVFGKWCRPDYNSVVATFCHNIARGLPISVRDPGHQLELIHVDDVVDTLVRLTAAPDSLGAPEEIAAGIPSRRTSLGELAELIHSFRSQRDTLLVPDLSSRFHRQLYGTYISYLEPAQWAYQLERREDPRGDLAEFIKSPWCGQIFVSRTRPGITRGNHFHHTKSEKFLVLAGSGLIRFRHVALGDVLEFPVRGEEYKVFDIPPGYTHSITNTGDTEMITLFWASEVLDPERPDTTYSPVLPSPEVRTG